MKFVSILYFLKKVPCRAWFKSTFIKITLNNKNSSHKYTVKRNLNDTKEYKMISILHMNTVDVYCYKTFLGTYKQM